MTGQQSALQASNQTWLAKKAEKLTRKCEALLKSAEGFKSSLTKLTAKRDEIWNQRRSWTTATAESVKARWNTAWAAFQGNMLLVRDGRQEAPKKRNSVEDRLQDLVAASAAIVTAKKKLEAKAQELCVESASLASVLRLHADQWSEVENATDSARNAKISFDVDAEALFGEDDLAPAVDNAATPSLAVPIVADSPAVFATIRKQKGTTDCC